MLTLLSCFAVAKSQKNKSRFFFLGREWGAGRREGLSHGECSDAVALATPGDFTQSLAIGVTGWEVVLVLTAHFDLVLVIVF